MQQRHIDKALFEDNIHEKHLRWRKNAVLSGDRHGHTDRAGGYTPSYPEIATASLTGPEDTGTVLRYTFSRAIGSKG